MTSFFLIGTLLGLSAGLSPGPLLTLVVSETFRHDFKAGIKVAISPLITDLPIILLTVIILDRLSVSCERNGERDACGEEQRSQGGQVGVHSRLLSWRHRLAGG